MKAADDIKAMLASAVGLGTQFTTVDDALKLVIGCLTAFYLCLKIWKLMTTGKDPEP